MAGSGGKYWCGHHHLLSAVQFQSFPQSVFHTTRNICAIDRQAIKADVSTLVSTLNQPTADQLNDQLRALLDRHAPATQRKVPQRRSSQWYSAVASQLRALKQEKRRAERQWLRSDLTVHRHIFNDLKHKITRLVDRAKMTFYSSKITVSTTCKELFSVTDSRTKQNVHRYHHRCLLLSSLRGFLTSSVKKSAPYDRTLTVALALLPLVLLISFFSGKPLTHFNTVSETAVSALF